MGLSKKDVHQGVQAGRGAAARAREFPGHGKQRWAEGRMAELERKIGQQALEIGFLTGACSALRNSGCCRL